MRSLALMSVLLIALFLALFGFVTWLEPPLLTDPSPWLAGGGWVAASIGVGLLVADVLIPVPASIVMTAHGAFFGILAGTLLSTLGSLGAAWFGFWIGRRGGGLRDRLVPERDRERIERWLDRWGAAAIVATRPVPLLAETAVILAGASAMSWRRLTLAALAGSLPPALLYAAAGAWAVTTDRFLLVFLAVLILAGGFWVLGRPAN